MNGSKKTYLTLGFLMLCALLLAAVPALMVWKWHIMSLADPSALIGLIAAWVAALIILAVCVWYQRQLHTKPTAAQIPVGTPAAER